MGSNPPFYLLRLSPKSLFPMLHCRRFFFNFTLAWNGFSTNFISFQLRWLLLAFSLEDCNVLQALKESLHTCDFAGKNISRGKMLLASCVRLTNCFPLSNLVVFLFVYVYSERRKSLTGPITVCMLANLVQNVKTCMLGNQLK